MKELEFLGDSLDVLRGLPDRARRMAGFRYVLHCFQKKSQRTPQGDIDIARRRLQQLMQQRG